MMIACFAKLGDQMAIYMVKKKLIGRLFDILHEGDKANSCKGKFKELFRDYSDVPYKEDPEDPDIGLPQTRYIPSAYINISTSTSNNNSNRNMNRQ